MNIYLTSLGCKLNQAEVESLARRAEAHGHQVVRDPVLADWAIINTCTVTHIAARKSRQMIRRLHKLNTGLHMAVTGCYAEMSGEEAQHIDGVDLVVPNAYKDQVMERILALASDGVSPARPRSHGEEAPHRLSGGHTRAFVKIQDGCDNRCTYCIVTTARGPSRSRLPDKVLAEIRDRLAEGYQEIVLTGVNIGAYARDRISSAPLPRSAGWSLTRLVRAILDETEVPRLRLSSIEPWDLAPDLLDLWANDRLCRHVHLPLQSGCDDVLRRMGRKYATSEFERLVEGIRQYVPDVSITTDVIVGFPGETEAEFGRTASFVERAGLSRLHVFKYSARPGTRAAEMPDQVDPRVVQARSQKLIVLGRRLACAFHTRFIGSDVEVLFEYARDDQGSPVWSGLTDNYLRVSASTDRDLANALATVRCLHADETGLRGDLIE